jgi:two-component system response regulator AtoC
LNNKLLIKIFSDSNDVLAIESALSKVDFPNYEISIEPSQNIEAAPDDIIIVQIDDLDSPILTGLIELKSNLGSIAVCVVNNGNPLVVSTVAKLGFTDIYVFPYEVFKFTTFIKETLERVNLRRINRLNLSNISKKDSFSSFIGKSKPVIKAIELAESVAASTSLNILILGETGTGKGVLAKSIHNAANEKPAPFIDVLCTAIPETLLESELFGYEKGAFTNATNKKLGLFELAENGTLFLDEIGDLSLNLQSKLLRVIEKKVIRRLGGVYDIPLNTRIIAATNQNLEKMVQDKLFRNDLYYRLNALTITLPPLRERGEDLLILTEYFVEDFCRLFQKKINKIENDVLDFIRSYDWPGNIRQLRNSLERAVLLTQDSTLRLKYFENLVSKPAEKKIDNNGHLAPNNLRLEVNYKSTDLSDLEKLYVKEVLQKFDGNKSQTAKTLGISRPKLDRLLRD